MQRDKFNGSTRTIIHNWNIVVKRMTIAILVFFPSLNLIFNLKLMFFNSKQRCRSRCHVLSVKGNAFKLNFDLVVHKPYFKKNNVPELLVVLKVCGYYTHCIVSLYKGNLNSREWLDY